MVGEPGERIFKALNELARRVSSKTLERLEVGLQAASLNGDVAMLYHFASMLAPDYYGDPLPYTALEYYKTYRRAPRVRLPSPPGSIGMDLLQAIRARRSRREFSHESLDLAELSTILYYSLGITGRAWWGGPKRAYPSAGALQPVEAYVYADRVKGVEKGLYHYNPGEHSLETLFLGDYAESLYRISLEQEHVRNAACVIILTAVYRRTASKYSHRSYRYAHWDVGFAGQNIYLVVEGLGLATTAVGAFYDEDLCEFIGIDCKEEFPMLLFPIGRRG